MEAQHLAAEHTTQSAIRRRRVLQTLPDKFSRLIIHTCKKTYWLLQIGSDRVGPLLTPKPERWPFFVLLEHFVAEVCSSAALPTLAGGCHCQLLQRFQSSGLQVALLGSACLHRMWRYVFRCSHT